MDDTELIRLARKMVASARPPLLDLYQRFIELAATGKGTVRFDKKSYQRTYMREYMRQWRAKQRGKK